MAKERKRTRVIAVALAAALMCASLFALTLRRSADPSRRDHAKLAEPRDHRSDWTRLASLSTLVDLSLSRGDSEALERAVRELRVQADRIPASPVPHQLLGVALAGLGGFTRDPVRFREAHESVMGAIARGDVRPDCFRHAFYCALRAEDKTLAARTARTMLRETLAPDVPCAEIIVLMTRSRLLDRAIAAALLSRGRDGSAHGQARVESWLTEIRG